MVRNYERKAPAKARWELALASMRVERELEDREDVTRSGENMVLVSLCILSNGLLRFRERGRELWSSSSRPELSQE